MQDLTAAVTVSQLNEFVKALLDTSEFLYSVCVVGEISNFTNHYKTGHFYFTLKDSMSQIKVVMFKSYAQNVKFVPADGMKVMVYGRVSAFVRDGVYQVYAYSIAPDGIGALYTAFEQTKAALESEGLFLNEHKKPIPKYPCKIGIITSPSGAAVADMKNIITRRFPVCKIIIYPAAVQGADAAHDLICGIKYFENEEKVDTIIIGRGGGSFEDLFAFNDTHLAYAIYNTKTPVISAVGHETDFTICDFVADLRAPTPSAAAELAVPEKNEIELFLQNTSDSFFRIMDSKILFLREKISSFKKMRKFYDYRNLLEDKRNLVLNYSEKLDSLFDVNISGKRAAVFEKSEKISALNPMSVLMRGYSLVTDKATEKILSEISQIHKGDEISIRLYDGIAQARISEKRRVKKDAD